MTESETFVMLLI